MPRTTTASAALALVLALTLAGCASGDSGDAAEGAAPASASAMKKDPAASASAMQKDEAAESEDAAMAEEGITVDRKRIVIAEPIKALGVYTVQVKLYGGEMSDLKVWVVKE